MQIDLLSKPETAPEVKTPTAPPPEVEAAPERLAYPTPEPLAAIVNEVCSKLKVEHDLAAPLALGAISTAAGANLLLEDRGRKTGSNIFTFCTAPSGSGKSEADRKILGPLHEIQNERIEWHAKKTLPQIRANRELLETEKKKIKGKAGGDAGDRDSWRNRLIKIEQELEALRLEEMAPALMIEDATTQSIPPTLEALGFIALHSPDAGEVIQNICGRYNEGSPDAEIFLKCHSREPVKVQRRGRPSVFVAEAVMSLVLLGTPDLGTELFSKARFKQGGLLPRFLFSASSSKPQPDTGESYALEYTIASNWQRTLAKIVEHFHDAEQRQIIKTSKAASEFFRQAYNDNLPAVRNGPAPAFASRTIEQAKRLAVCLHAAQHGAKSPQEELSEDSARQGIALAHWHYQQALEMLGQSEFETDLAMLKKLKLHAKNNSLSLTEARHRANLAPEQVRALIARRPEWLKIDKIPTGGAPLNQIQIL